MCLTIKKLWMIFAVLILMASPLQGRAANKYGFGDVLGACSLWQTFFPLGFRKANTSLSNINAEVNIFYVTMDGIKGMDDYVDLYSVQGTTVWPTEPWLFKGDAPPICTTASECQSGQGTVGKGVSAYNSLLSEYSNGTLKVAQQSISPTSTTNSTWFFLPVRMLTLLRIEIFIPNKIPDGKNASEPFFVEYRGTSDDGNLKRTDIGGTADFSRVNLPETINLNNLSGIEIWLNNTNDLKPISGFVPEGAAYTLTTSMSGIVPDNCK